jgi:hypothetical protein
MKTSATKIDNETLKIAGAFWVGGDRYVFGSCDNKADKTYRSYNPIAHSDTAWGLAEKIGSVGAQVVLDRAAELRAHNAANPFIVDEDFCSCCC